MYKKLMQILLGSLTLGLLAAGSAQAFDEGIDYKTVTTPQETEAPPGKIEVAELFWYGCPHCYHIEADLKAWLARKPDYVTFRRIPAVLGTNWAMGAKVFYAAELLGVLDRVGSPFFKAVHEDNLTMSDPNKVADWFATQGVKREAFLSALNSFAVDMKVRKSTEICTALELDGVPSFLINGRYMTSPSMTASVEKAFQVIDELTAKLAHPTPPPVAPTATPSTGPAAASVATPVATPAVSLQPAALVKPSVEQKAAVVPVAPPAPVAPAPVTPAPVTPAR